MKKRIVLSILAIMMVAAVTACGNNKTSGKSTTDTTTTTAAASSDGTETYNVLTVKTDWEEKGTITFSDSGIDISGSGATAEDGVCTITEGGSYTLTGTSEDCSIVINTEENVKLILNDVTLTSTTGPVIYGSQVKNLYIEMAEGTTNNLTDSDTYATDSTTGEEIGKGVISCEDDVVILGEGTLNITANHKHGIVSDDKLYVESGIINITSNGTDGMHANDLVCIDGGNINITAASDLIESEDVLVVTGGEITGSSEDEGIESKNAVYINGGTIDIKAEDDGINAATYLEINDGSVTVSTNRGDALDCNGNSEGCITINGGTVYALGGGTPEGGIDADNSSAVINGGTVVAVGDVNSPISDTSKQTTVVYGSFNANEKIEIKDSDGNSLFAYTPEVSGNTMIISVAGLENGSSYTVYANDEESISFTVDSVVVEAGGSANGMGGMGGPGQGGGPGGNFGGGQGGGPGGGQMERGQRPEGFEGEPPEDLKQEAPSL